MLLALKLDKELERTKEKKVRAGRGKMRGRKYKKKVGPLIVVSKKCALEKAAKNIPGIQTCRVTNLNTEKLAPGTLPGRFTIFTEEALIVMSKQKLFTQKK